MLRANPSALLGASLLAVTLAAATLATAQTGAPPASLGALIDQAVALFPKLEGDVIDVQAGTVTLSVSRRDGARPGLALEAFREGRELRHPRTGQLLGRAEQSLGRVVVTEVFEQYSTATPEGGAADDLSPGDRVRTSAARLRLVLTALPGPGSRPALLEAVTSELYEGLHRTGRFQVIVSDQVSPWLAQQGIPVEEFLEGRGVPEASEHFKFDNMLIVRVRQVDRKPFLDARVFTAGRGDAAVDTAFFVPPSIRPAPSARFSTSDRTQPGTPERRPRSLLARLLGGDLEAGTYSSGEAAIPLREVARFPFTVVSMDVSVAPADRIPRLAVTDGEQVWVYKIVDGALEPDWTFSARSVGPVVSVQLADLTGDGALEVVANRHDPKVGMSSLIIGLKADGPVALVDHVDAILYAVDDAGAGVKQTLWAQRYREESFFARGQADEMRLQDGALVRERPALVPDTFRATGATFSNIMGQKGRALVFIDEHSRLRITVGSEDVWRSSSGVGGGGRMIEVQRWIERGGRSFFYRMEPPPLAVDLDGDGVEEIVVPQNQAEGGMLAVVFRGPAGLRFQRVSSGFEGVIVGLGAIPEEHGGPPALIAGVVRHTGFLRVAGETQIIMAGQE